MSDLINNKEPITGLEEGNCCPKCGSTKVILYMQFPLIAKFDMKGKEIVEGFNGKRMHKPSNQRLAALYRSATRGEYQCANYECTKCGWMSEMYVP